MAIINKVDFADLREDFKKFMQSQSEFTDYDMTQSGLDVIINLMSYGVHYDSIQANFSNSEMFLSTAQLRKNVTSRAKHLMYRPKSATAARAMVDIEVVEVDGLTLPNTLFIPKGTKIVTNDSLTTTIDFITRDAFMAERNGDSYVFKNIPIYEGQYLNTSQPYNGEGVVIPHSLVDIFSLEVYVQEDPLSTNYVKYELMNDLFKARKDSKVFYLEENYDGLYYVYFGDGVLGRKIEKGINVILTYNVCSAEAGNGLASFGFAKTPNPVDPLNRARVVVRTRDKSSGGSSRENIESIKFNAPKFFSTQRIILNDEDANAIIPHEYPDIKSVNVWSGKLSKAFGKTYISLNPYIDNLQQTRIDEILADLQKNRFVVLTELEYVRPSYLDISPIITVYFDGRTPIETIEKDLYESIVKYSNDNIEDFKREFISSDFIRKINFGNLKYDYAVELKSRVPAFVNSLVPYSFDFKNSVRSIKSNTFIRQGTEVWIESSGTDLILRSKAGIIRKVGVFDPSNGTGRTEDIVIQSVLNNTLEFVAQPIYESLFSSDNAILRILEKDIRIKFVKPKQNEVSN